MNGFNIAKQFVVKYGDVIDEVCMSKPGDAVVVPSAAWHTAKIAGKTSMLFITTYDGTLNDYKAG